MRALTLQDNIMSPDEAGDIRPRTIRAREISVPTRYIFRRNRTTKPSGIRMEISNSNRRRIFKSSFRKTPTLHKHNGRTMRKNDRKSTRYMHEFNANNQKGKRQIRNSTVTNESIIQNA